MLCLRCQETSTRRLTQKQTHQVDGLAPPHQHLSLMPFLGRKLVGAEQGKQFRVEAMGAPRVLIDGRAHRRDLLGYDLYEFERRRDGPTQCDTDHAVESTRPVCQ